MALQARMCPFQDFAGLQDVSDPCTMAAELGIAVLDRNIVLLERLAHDAVATVLDISCLSSADVDNILIL